MNSNTTLFLALLAAGLLACGDDDGGSGSGADAGPQVDAGPTPDAALATCAVDLSFGYPEGDTGALVVFVGPNGSVLTTTFTDVDGNASGPCVPGTAVTIDFATTDGKFLNRNVNLVTFVGVNPGDTIRIPEVPYVDNVSSASANINIPAPPDTPTTTFLSNGCGSSTYTEGTTANNFYFDDFCQTPNGLYDIVALTYADGEVIRHASALGVDVPAGSSGSSINLGDWVNVAGGVVDVSVINPTTETELTVVATQGRNHAEYTYDDDFWFGPLVDQLPITSQFAAMPAALAEHIDIESSASYGDFAELRGFEGNFQPEDSLNRMWTRTAPTASVTVDLALQLPRVAGALVSATATAFTVQFFTEGSMVDAGADGLMVDMDIDIDEYSGDWLVVAPANDGGTFPLPQLPSNLFPLANAEIFAWRLSFFDYSWLTYREVITGGVYPWEVGSPWAVPDSPDLARTVRSSGWDID